MDVSGVSGSSLLQLLWQTQNSQTGGTAFSNQTGFAQALSGQMNGPNPAEMSGPAQLFSKLQQLLDEDPEKFKEVMNQIADKFEEAAGEVEDGDMKQMLLEMAEKHRSVAESGDLSQLQPQRPPMPPPGGMGGGGGIGSYMKQADAGQTLLDILNSEDDEETTAASGSTLDMRALFESIMQIINDAISEK